MASPIQIQRISHEMVSADLKSTAQKPIYFEKAIYSYDVQNNYYSFISSSIKSLLGYTPEELNKIGFENIVVDKIDEHIKTYSSINSESSVKQESIVTYLLNGSDGEPKWIEDNSITILDPINKTEYRVGFLCDLGNQLKGERVRKIIADILEDANSEKNLSDLFKFIHTSVKKLMKADNFYIAYYKSETNTVSFPYFIDEYDDDSSPKKLGKGLTEYVLRSGKSALVDKKLDRELNLKGETELLGPQSEIWLGVPLKIIDKVIGVLVVQDYHDPTTYTTQDQQILDVISYPISRAIERKIDEEEKNNNLLKLKELNKSKDQLFSLISNDLRNPFNSLLGFADVLANEFESLTQRDIKEYLNVINESSKTLFWMTNNLLHYSRMQLGKFPYNPQVINLAEAVRNSIEYLKKNIKAKDLAIKNLVAQEYSICADEEMLIITLNNLISNAIKYSLTGNTINVTAELTLTDKEFETNCVKVFIKDNGVGISNENLKRLKNKEMFSTLGTAKEFGTGLGLLLSNDLTEKNSGTLKIHSKVNEGTVAEITLPSYKSS